MVLEGGTRKAKMEPGCMLLRHGTAVVGTWQTAADRSTWAACMCSRAVDTCTVLSNMCSVAAGCTSTGRMCTARNRIHAGSTSASLVGRNMSAANTWAANTRTWTDQHTWTVGRTWFEQWCQY